MLDYAVYYMTALVSLLDPVEKVAAFVIYRTRGILYLPNPNEFGGSIKFALDSMDWDKPAALQDIPLEFPYGDNARDIGPAEMAEAIRENRENRASKEMADHVLEVLTAIQKSGETGMFCEILSTL